jgi:antitoxin CptB
MSQPLISSPYLKRLLYLSTHRGCKETDFILGGFAQTHLSSLTKEECDLYESLLQENDWDIYAWLTGSLPVPTKYDDHSLLHKIKKTISL